MIDLYYWPTPNGHKITMFLEEAQVPYQIKPVNLQKGDQFKPDYLKISPNNKMPAIVDTDSGISIFESGVILLYLAEKTGKFLSADKKKKLETLEWVMWQNGGLGPMLGQNHHFRNAAPEKILYAIERYTKETERLYGVLDKRLEGREYMIGEYSIADMMSYPWIKAHEMQGIDIDKFPNVKAWFERIKNRPATIRAYEQEQKVKNG